MQDPRPIRDPRRLATGGAPPRPTDTILPRLLVPLLSLRPRSTSIVVYVARAVPEVVRAFGGEVVLLGDAFARRLLADVPATFVQRDVADRRVLRLLALRRHLPAAVREHRPDCLWVPDGNVIGAVVDVPAVLVLHHHLNFSRPQGMPWGQRLYWRIWHDRDIRASVRRAAAVVVPTRAFADEVASILPESAGKLAIVPHGVSEAYRPLPGSGRGDVRSVLVVGNRLPYKNVAGALRIFARACEGLPHRLRVAGMDRQALDAMMARERIPATVGDRVDALGLLEEARLAEEYRMADALLFPSWLESFGLPVLEAMASGLPVACSNLPSLREVTSGAAELAAPSDETAFAAALRRVLTDAGRAGELRAAGLERARAFSWALHGERTAAVIHACMR